MKMRRLPAGSLCLLFVRMQMTYDISPWCTIVTIAPSRGNRGLDYHSMIIIFASAQQLAA